MDQTTIQTVQTEIRQLEAEVARLDEQRRQKKVRLTRKRKAMKLWTDEKSTGNGSGGNHGTS